MDGDERRCRKHPALSCGGVCPYCLRYRLLRLCPECARTHPCPCASSYSSSSSSSASGSAVARVYSLIERERRMDRSRSVATGGGGIGGGGRVGDESRRSKVFGWASFRKATSGTGSGVEDDDGTALARSSSASATAVETRAASKARGWGRFIPGSIKALRLRHRKSRSGDCRESVHEVRSPARA
ncbi:hypothetical protein GUJ93_ZPchr0014g46613 [Zizania palustris]|uniref:Uncharacterized protein n=1 Tax=Zizania palustris TaxID=103762 RepID=A0A8J5SXQ6_ZIZPA|nr:hypothetical protein GUJ93_ZPchr0014g46613 [Zizania palustris]